MEIRTEPSYLEALKRCKFCKRSLIIEIKPGQYMEDKQPWCTNCKSSSVQIGTCTCIYLTKDFIYYTCTHCKEHHPYYSNKHTSKCEK